MAIDIFCPSCRTTFRAPEETRGKKVRCKSCQEPFIAKEGKPPRQEDRDSTADDRMQSDPPSRTPARSREEDRRPDRAPARRGRGADEDSDSDLPAVRGRREDREDRDPPRTRKQNPEKGSALGLIIGGAIAGVVLLIGGVVGAVLILKSSSPTPTVAKGPPVVNTVVGNPAVAPGPKVPDPVVPAPKAPDPFPAPKAPDPVVPAPKAPDPVVPAPKVPDPVVPAPKVPDPVVLAPQDGTGTLSYRWNGGPHVYSVRVEIEAEKTIENHRGVCIIRPEKNADGYKLNCAGGMVKHERPRTGDVKTPIPDTLPGTTTANWITIEASGKIRDVTRGGLQLPYLLGEMGVFLIVPLPPDNRNTWEISGDISLSESPAGGRPMRGPGRLPIRPKGPKGPKAPPPAPSRVGDEKSVYTRGDTVGDTVAIKKRYEMKFPAKDDSPAINLTGDGKITFTLRNGMPRTTEFKGALAFTGKTMSGRIPLTVTYTLLEGAERERILNPPPPPKVAPKPPPKEFTDADVTQVLADLSGTDVNKRWAAVDQLAKAGKATARREDVAKALIPLLADTGFFHRMACLNALAVWGTKDNVPSLLPLLSDSNGSIRVGAVKALGEIKDERAAEPIAKLLTAFWDRGEAVKALQKIGSKAEKVVLPYLKHTDAGVRTEACKILKVIGTRESKTALEAATSDTNVRTRNAAKEALKEIAGRS